MKITITIVAILCVSAIDGAAVKRQEYNVPALLDELGTDAVKKNDDLKACVREHINALDVYDRIVVANNRLTDRLKGVTDDLSTFEECYHDKLLDETYLKWKQSYIDDDCIQTKIADLADGGAKETKRPRVLFDINRTLMSFNREMKKRGDGRPNAIGVIRCFRYKSKDAVVKFTAPQKTCFDSEITAAGLDAGVDVLLLEAKDVLDTGIRRFGIESAVQSAIDLCKSATPTASKTFTKDEEHYDLSCLKIIGGFEDYGDRYNNLFVDWHLAIKSVAKDKLDDAKKLRDCYDAV